MENLLEAVLCPFERQVRIGCIAAQSLLQRPGPTGRESGSRRAFPAWVAGPDRIRSSLASWQPAYEPADIGERSSPTELAPRDRGPQTGQGERGAAKPWSKSGVDLGGCSGKCLAIAKGCFFSKEHFP